MYKINHLAKEARVWAYVSDRFLTEDEKILILNEGEAFINSWSAHGDKLHAGIMIKENCLLILAVDENEANASGCSIDKSVHFIKSVEQKLNLSFLDWQNTAYIDNDRIILLKRDELEAKLNSGQIDTSVKKLNLNINSLKDIDNLFE